MKGGGAGICCMKNDSGQYSKHHSQCATVKAPCIILSALLSRGDFGKIELVSISLQDFNLLLHFDLVLGHRGEARVQLSYFGLQE